MSQLPDKMSGLIRLSIADLKKVLALPERYAVDMGSWHTPRSDGICSVCQAGAVMAMTLSVARSEHMTPGRLYHPEAPKLEALNYLRIGDVPQAACVWGLLEDDILLAYRFGQRHSIPQWHHSPYLFMDAQLQLAADLEAVGL